MKAYVELRFKHDMSNTAITAKELLVKVENENQPMLITFRKSVVTQEGNIVSFELRDPVLPMAMRPISFCVSEITEVISFAVDAEEMPLWLNTLLILDHTAAMVLPSRFLESEVKS